MNGIHRISAGFAGLLGVLRLAAPLTLTPADAVAKTDELGSWNTFGLEYGFRNTKSVGYTDAAGQSKTGTGQQASYAFSARGNLWRPQSRTFLRTLPGMNYDFTILKFSEEKALDGDLSEYANQDKSGAGWMFGIKVGAPWALIENPRLKLGVGVRWEQAKDPDFMELALAVAYRV